MSELDRTLVNIPAFSPSTAQALLRIKEAIDRRIATGGVSLNTVEELQCYSEAIATVIRYSLIHQKAAIDEFQHLLRTMAEDTNQ